MPAFRFLDQPAGVAITVDGEPFEAAAGRSLLASLLAAGRAGAAADFSCAIGQCQRCIVRVDGVARPACLTYPQGGERVETRSGDGRPPPWADQPSAPTAGED
jgi:aerobic-type carbon monoxide dehydrogenase small subunit (CoxS/CutS family)